MAAPPEHRGGFLTKRRLLLLLAALFLAGCCLAWLLQARLLLAALNRFPGGAARAERAEGSLTAGLRFYGVSFTGSSFRGGAAEVFVRPEIVRSLAGKPGLAELRIISPWVVLSPGGGGCGSPPARFPLVRLAVISDGRLEAGERTVTGINCRLALSGEKIEAASCGGTSAGLSVVLAGEYSPGLGAARGRLSYPRESAAADFEYSLIGEKHVFSAKGSAGGAPLDFLGEITGESWQTALYLKELLPLNVLSPSFKPVKLRSASISASGRGFSPGKLSARGKFSIDEKAGSSAEGSFNLGGGRAAIQGTFAQAGLSGSFDAAGAPLKFDGKTDGVNWNASVLLRGTLPLDALNPALRPAAFRSAAISASGKGLTRGTAAAGGKFSVDQKPGSSAEGTFGFRSGYAVLETTYSLAGLSGTLQAAVSEGAISGSLGAAGGVELNLAGGKTLSVRGAKAACSLAGTLESPAAACGGGAGEIRSGALFAAGAEFSSEVTAGRRENFRLRLSVLSPAFRGVSVDSASITLEGSRQDNEFSAEAFYAGNSARLQGRSSFKDGVLRAALDGFHVSRSPAWKLCAPAAVSVTASGGTKISGFCLNSGKSSISFSGIFRKAFPDEFHAAVRGFELAELGTAGLTGLKPVGVLDAAADYSSASPGPGKFHFTGGNLELRGIALGAASARGTFAPGAARLETAEWKIYGGEAKVSGSAVMAEGGTKADLSIRISSMNVAPLLAFAPQVSAAEIWADGESRLALAGGAFRTSGALNFFAPRLRLETLGLRLDNARLRLEAGDLHSARISASARNNGGKISAEGPLSVSGPELKLRASDLPFAHLSGLSGRASTEMLLAGSWSRPKLSGTADLGETKFETEKWGKYRPEKEKSRFYEAMSMDLRIAAERNAWYRDGANSVEVKGDLLLKKDHYSQPVLLGTVSALKGYYIYLGNTFTVTSGQMIFTGENPPNPEIKAAAVSESRGDPIKVYFNAAGKIRNPQVTLSSDPPMEQRDVISYLVTGKPLYELYAPRNGAQQGRTGDNTAQNLAAGYISQKAAATVGKKLEMDVINLKVTAENKADITVGRYVMKDLFVSYGQVLGQGGEKRVSAEYSISRHWSLEGKNSSDGRYVTDLLFKFGIK